MHHLVRIRYVISLTALLALSGCSRHAGTHGMSAANHLGHTRISGIPAAVAAPAIPATGKSPIRWPQSNLNPSHKNPFDVVVASHQGVQVWFGQGSGRFQATDQGFIPLDGTTSAALGDLDGDGDLDMFVTRYQQERNQVWFNNSRGRFRRSSQSFPPGDHWRSALGDLDGDGDLDVFVTGTTSYKNAEGQPNEVWLNDGKGFFTDSKQRLGRAGSYSDVALNDLDEDGDLDAIVIASSGGAIWLNQGKAIFQDSGKRIGSTNSMSSGIALGDVDGDGDPDAFLANLRTNEVWLNQGKGQFVRGQVLAEAFETFAVALGDLDGDGDRDAFLANTRKKPNRVLLNDGKGHFTDSGQLLGSDVTLSVALADFDQDGDLDAFEANRASLNRLWLNDGKGRFTDSGQDLGNWWSRKIAFGWLR